MDWRKKKDRYTISQISDYSVADILEVLDYLEWLFSKQWDNETGRDKLLRALIAALSLHARIHVIWKGSRATKSDLT